jgi:hypothetical protein
VNPKAKRAGYIAVSRAIFEHHLFCEKRAFSHLEAWLWLLAEAAWKPEGRRAKRGMVSLKRTQLAAAVREIGLKWGWPKSKVARFLAFLKREGMISINPAALNTVDGTMDGTPPSTALSIITICNYDTYQPAPKKLGQQAGQQAGQSGQKDLLFQLGPQAKQNKQQINRESRGAAKQRLQEKPYQGARSRDGKWVWLDHGTEEWALHAADFGRVRQAELLPETRIGGRGNWFVVLGEAARPRRKRA